MKLAIITSGFLPVPATKGGAVENLIENLIRQNDKDKKMQMYLFSVYDKCAIKVAEKYKNTEIKFIKINPIAKILDKIVFFIAKKIMRKNNSQSYRFIFQRLYYLYEVSKCLKKKNFDKVLLENHPTQYLALKWKKNYIKYKDNYYYHCHNEFTGTYGCKNIIMNTKKFLCVSDYIAQTLAKYLGCNKDKCTVLKNCIDTERFTQNLSKIECDKIKVKYNIPKEDIVLLYTGRLVPEKGIKELITSLKKVKNNKFKLIIVGSSLNNLNVKTNFELELEKLYLEVKEKIIFTGFIEYNEIWKYYKIADIAVLPSVWDDPAPLTVIESMVSGLPIITTNSGGIPEYADVNCADIIDRDENLVKHVADSIEKLIQNEMKRKEMECNSIKLSKEWTVEKYYQNFVEKMCE